MRNGIKGIALSLIGATLLANLPAAAQSNPENERVVRDFYDAAINQKDYDKAAAFLGPYYRQHNPNAGDGHEGLRAFLDVLKRTAPQYRSEIKRVFSDKDHVILHVHNVREPGTRGAAIIDIFRLEKGKIVEHWDVRQDIPEKAAHDNGMF